MSRHELADRALGDERVKELLQRNASFKTEIESAAQKLASFPETNDANIVAALTKTSSAIIEGLLYS